MKDPAIKKVSAQEILDSRGNPTVMAEVETDHGKFLASVPSGASKGKNEALELRDGGERMKGLGVLQAVKNINEKIGPAIIGKNPTNQNAIDDVLRELDGTANKRKLGANAILAVSMAVCRAGAKTEGYPLYRHIAAISGNRLLHLPKPFMLFAEGGMHAENNLDFQEFILTSIEERFSENFKSLVKTFKRFQRNVGGFFGIFKIKYGDEGGLCLEAKKPEEVLDLFLESMDQKTRIVLDVAASHFFLDQKYSTNFGFFETKDLCDYYLALKKKYPIFAIEDPFSENDSNEESWKELKKSLVVIGDDLTVTNPEIIKSSKDKDLCSGVIIKPNQIGTVSEAINALSLAKSFGWKTVVSHRSGETEDDFIADFAVGNGADFIKAGAPTQKERVVKYERLIKIERELNK